jgi:hypothetical protein
MELCDLYWLAGILEGEGTFVSGPPSQPNSPIARISMTDLDTVTRAAGRLDRAVTPVRARKPHHKPVFNTQIKGAEAVALMMAVRPILGPDRTRQIGRVLAGWAPRRRSSQADPRNMCDELVVRRAAEVLGARKVARRIPDQPHWRPTYVAKIGGAHAAEWMRNLRALMSQRRQAAIERALAAYRPVHLVSPPATCIVERCDQPHRGRGLCHKHYMMWSRDRAKGRIARIAPLR